MQRPRVKRLRTSTYSAQSSNNVTIMKQAGGHLSKGGRHNPRDLSTHHHSFETGGLSTVTVETVDGTEVVTVTGPAGPPPTLSIGTVSVGPTDATIVDSGSGNYTLDLVLEKGADSTVQGPAGPPPTLSIGTVTVGPTDATIVDNGSGNYTLDLVLEKGADSTVEGPKGDDGQDATLTVVGIEGVATLSNDNGSDYTLTIIAQADTDTSGGDAPAESDPVDTSGGDAPAESDPVDEDLVIYIVQQATNTVHDTVSIAANTTTHTINVNLTTHDLLLPKEPDTITVQVAGLTLSVDYNVTLETFVDLQYYRVQDTDLEAASQSASSLTITFK